SDRAGPARHRHPARAARPQFRGSLCGDRLGRRRDPGEGRAEPRFGGDRAPRKPGGRAPEGRGRGTRPPPALRRDGQDDRRAGTLSRRDREPAGRRAAGRSRPVKAPAFWWRQEQSPAAMLLSPLAAAFGAAAARRMGRPAHYRAPVPVICVGNLVVGGAGKTPAALALAALARSEGLRPGFVATGYGGSASAPTLVERDAPAELVGDEALMLAAAAPTVVAADRAAAAVRLIGEGVAVIIMDDGFQNPRLAKDLSLVVVDAAAGIGNGRVMPAGPLRAPLDAQIARADALIVIGGETASHPSLGAVIRAG